MKLVLSIAEKDHELPQGTLYVPFALIFHKGTRGIPYLKNRKIDRIKYSDEGYEPGKG